jgi:dTMP kinase
LERFYAINEKSLLDQLASPVEFMSLENETSSALSCWSENLPNHEPMGENSARWGKLIVFEGVEGSGKTSALRRLRQWLRDSGWLLRLKSAGIAQQVVVTREPGGTELGLGLRRLLLEVNPDAPIQDRAELLLYAADRSQHVEELLKPQLRRGAIILCDRYTDSTIAYQGYGRGLDLDLIAQLNTIATDGIASDLTFWLDLDPAAGLARKRQQQEFNRMEQADLAFHHRVQAGFTALAQAHPDRIARIDASLDEESVAQQIRIMMGEKLAQWFPKI